MIQLKMGYKYRKLCSNIIRPDKRWPRGIIFQKIAAKLHCSHLTDSIIISSNFYISVVEKKLNLLYPLMIFTFIFNQCLLFILLYFPDFLKST